MEVDHRGLQGAMTEILLDQSEVDPGFEQVGRVAVSESVDCDPLFDAKLLDQSLHRTMDTGASHWLGRGAGMVVVASCGRKEPDGVSMRGPVLAEHGQGAWRQGDIAVFCTLAAMDVDDHAGAVDV